MYRVYWLGQFGFKMQKQDNSVTGQSTSTHKHSVKQGLVLRRFALRRFTFTVLVELDRALPACASLSQFKRPLSAYGASSSFPVVHVFLLFLFQCSSFKLIVIFPPMTSVKKDRKEEKIKTADVTFFLDVFWTTAWAFFSKTKSDLIYIFSIIYVIFYIPNLLN